jgi:biotin carboxylase
VAIRLEAEAQGAFSENNDIYVERLIVRSIFLLNDVEGSETGEVIRGKELDFLSRLLH